jgi:hypothetical protein
MEAPRLNYGFYKVGSPVTRRDVLIFVYQHNDTATYDFANALPKELKNINVDMEMWACNVPANSKSLKEHHDVTVEYVPSIIYKDFVGIPSVLNELTTPAAAAAWVKSVRVKSALALIETMN